MRRAVWLVAGCAAVAAPRHVRAQGGFDDGRRLAVESGAAVLRQVGARDLVAPTVAVDWRSALAPRAPMRLAATGTLASDRRWAAQLVGGASQYVGRTGEIGAQVTAVRFQSAPLTTQAQAVARHHVVTGSAARLTGAWAGLSAGGTVRGLRARPMAGLESGLWHTWRPEVRVGLTVSALAALLDSTVSRGAGLRLSEASERFRAFDAVASAEWRAARLELAGFAGMRHARDVTPLGETSAPWRIRPLTFLSATVWAAPTLGFVASAGEQFADPIRGVPAVRHLALAVRLRARAPRRAPPPPPVPPMPAATRAAPQLVMGDSAQGREAHARVLAPGAERVWLRADATGWRPVELTSRGDGVWELPVALASGTHRLMVRIDDGAWIPPANLPAVDDEFGSRVGLLVVP